MNIFSLVDDNKKINYSNNIFIFGLKCKYCEHEFLSHFTICPICKNKNIKLLNDDKAYALYQESYINQLMEQFGDIAHYALMGEKEK